MAEETNLQDSETKQDAVNLRSIREIVKDLSKPIAQKHLRKRRQGGKEITYLACRFQSHNPSPDKHWLCL